MCGGIKIKEMISKIERAVNNRQSIRPFLFNVSELRHYKAITLQA